MLELYREIHVSKDNAVLDVAAYAFLQAKESLVPVAFRFHGVMALVMPSDNSPDAALAAWSDDYDSATLLVGSVGA